MSNLRKQVFKNPLIKMDSNIPSMSATRRLIFKKYEINNSFLISYFFNKEIYLIFDESQKKYVKYFFIIAATFENPLAQYIII